MGPRNDRTEPISPQDRRVEFVCRVALAVAIGTMVLLIVLIFTGL
ncbi:MAG: hypothetical protein RBT71_09365 [Flavobacteriales bacterium]|jgi:hypothetical protein|nr:hypothetical protein [Flavobacteriales bacterium]